MRFTPLVGRKAWFGPRDGGWGWEPVSWEGWAATAVSLASALGCAALPRSLQVPAFVAAVSVLLAACILKGTQPGGPEAADRFREIRRHARRTPEMTEADRVRRRLTEDEPSMTAAAERLRSVPRRRHR